MMAPKMTLPRTATGLAGPDRLLRVRDTADLLGISVRQVHRLAASGHLSKVKIGKTASFRLSDLEALIERGTL